MADVFISYAREDKPFVRALAETLAAQQRDVWVDLDDILPSEQWRQAIERGIEDADAIVVVLSPDWLLSKPCGDEVAHALRHNKRLVPILCRAVADDGVPEPLASLNWIEWLSDDDRNAALDRLRMALEADPEWVRAHTRLVTLAVEWDRRNRTRSQLLRGDDLQRAEDWLARAATVAEPKPTELQSAYILASQHDQRRSQRIRLWAVAGALGIMLALVMVALFQWNEAVVQRNDAIQQSNVRATAEANAIAAADARATAQTFAEEQQQVAEEQRKTAVAQREVAEDRRKLALAGKLAAQSTDHLDDNYAVALLLAVEATRVAPTVEARSSLFAALEYSPHLQTFLRGHTTEIHSVAVNPEGTKVAAGALLGEILLWDLAQGGPPITLRGMPGPVNSLAFSPGGQLLASGHGRPDFGKANDTTLALWDLPSGQLHGDPIRGPWGAVTKVSFSPDRKTLLSVNSDNTAALWDLASRQVVRSFANAGAASLSSDGTMVAMGDRDGEIRILDVASGLANTVLPAISQRASFTLADLIFSPNGASVLVKSLNTAAVRRIDGDGQRGLTFPAFGVAMSPNGSIIAAGTVDGTIDLRNADNFEARGARLAGHTYAPSSLAFTTDSTHLVSGGLDTNVIVWRIDGDQRLGTILEGLTGDVLDFDGRLVLWKNDRDQLGLWDVASRRTIAPPVATDGEDRFDIGPLHDGSALACTIDGHDVTLWDLATGQQRGPSLGGHTAEVVAVAVSPDGRWLASGSNDRVVVLWNLASTPPSGVPLPSPSSSSAGLIFSPDGRLLVSRDNQDGLTFWDTTTRQSIPAPTARAARAIFSRDGRTVALPFGSTMTLWDLSASRKVNGPAPAMTTNIGRRPLAFSPDGRLLAWGSDDTTFTIWDVANARLLAPPLSGHRIDVVQLVFSPDGALLATTDMRGSSIVWDLTTLQPIGPTLQSPYAGRSFSFAPDGKSFIASRTQTGVLLWDLDVENWKVQACNIVGRDLTEAERRQYLGDEPPATTCNDILAGARQVPRADGLP